MSFYYSSEILSQILTGGQRNIHLKFHYLYILFDLFCFAYGIFVLLFYVVGKTPKELDTWFTLSRNQESIQYWGSKAGLWANL